MWRELASIPNVYWMKTLTEKLKKIKREWNNKSTGVLYNFIEKEQ